MRRSLGKILAIAIAAAFLTMGASTALAADGPDDSPAIKKHHPSSTFSEYAYNFPFSNGGELKGLWSAPAYPSGNETWVESNGLVYDYWYATVDADGNQVFGSATNTNPDHDVFISADAAKEAFATHVRNFNWHRACPEWANADSISFSLGDPDQVEVNGREAYAYSGTADVDGKKHPVEARMVLDNDTASWVVVIDPESTFGSKAVEEAAGKLVKTYRNGTEYRSSSYFQTSGRPTLADILPASSFTVG